MPPLAASICAPATCNTDLQQQPTDERKSHADCVNKCVAGCSLPAF